MQNSLKSPAFWLVLFTALAARLYTLGELSFWSDELASWHLIQQPDLWSLIKRVPYDNTPPFYPVLLKCWTRLFGEAEWVMRLPSVLFGVGASVLGYLLGKKRAGDSCGLFLGLLTAVYSTLIFESQEVRNYSALVFFSYGTLLFWKGEEQKSFSLPLLFFSYRGLVHALLRTRFMGLTPLSGAGLKSFEGVQPQGTRGFICTLFPLVFYPRGQSSLCLGAISFAKTWSRRVSGHPSLFVGQ